jgi:hypothetical protein
VAHAFHQLAQVRSGVGDELVLQLTGQITYGLDLSGTWYCAWQTWKDNVPRIDVHSLEVHQSGDLLQLDAERALPVAEGSYRWRGELRLCDNEALIGWYRSTDSSSGSCATRGTTSSAC